MTATDAIDILYIWVTEILPDVPVYKLEKPDDLKHDLWVVVNSLPTSQNAGSQDGPITQDVVMNINVHARDLKKGYVDFVTLKTNVDAIKAELPYITPVLHAYEGGDNLFREAELQSHYQNIRLNVTLINY